ncbi:MAG: OmpA family protein [Rhodospirillales bacterium]|nr:OmpA family protein [Rhodospirillales bacterium]
MSSQTIIIKKSRKKHAAPHHGGAWKVAYADFVTAMMAFFLLLWLLNAVSQEQLQGISDYFSPISKHTSTTGGGGILQGEAIAIKGVFNAHAGDKSLTPTRAGAGSEDDDQDEQTETADPQLGEETATADEQAQFIAVEQALKGVVQGRADLQDLADSLVIEQKDDGLRIQLVDQDGLPMFPRGQPVMYEHTRRLLSVVADAVRQMPQLIEVAGHTDSVAFANDIAYGNWELSADRANAARRALIEAGMPVPRIERVVGRAATEPLFPDRPDAAGNRRLTITLLRGTSVQ